MVESVISNGNGSSICSTSTLPRLICTEKTKPVFEDDGTADILVSKFRTRDSGRQVDAGVLRYADLVGHATLPRGDTG